MGAMGWYPAVARPLLFSIDPEAAHRLAIAALGLPLPWARIGGAAPDPALEVDLCGIRLATPVGLAAGFDKGCARLGPLGALGFGFVVGGTVTRRPRAGNARPRIARSPRSRSLTNAMGLPNPGAEAAAEALARTRRTAPRLVSLADERLEDATAALAVVEPHVDGVELNASCPNVAWGRDRDDEDHVRRLVGAFRERTAKPVLVKLPPFERASEREGVLAVAAAAAAAGADGLVCSNTRRVADPRLATGAGGLSGRALWPRTVAIVGDVRAEIGLPVVACGGVGSADDVLACLEAGATAVEVYTALLYRGPGLPGALARGLSERLRARHATLADLAGTAQPGP
jgi:dihydroorotate dehydrogenase